MTFQQQLLEAQAEAESHKQERINQELDAMVIQLQEEDS